MNTRNIFLVSVVIFTGLLFIIPHALISPESFLGNTVLSISAFLFGLFAGFYILATTTDYNSVKNILAAESAGWISLYENVFIYDTQSAGKLSLLIDEFERYAFNFEIIDYAKSTNIKFESISLFMKTLPYKESMSSVHQNIRTNMDAIVIARQQLTVLGERTLSLFQWAIFLALAVAFILSLYVLDPGGWFFNAITVIISSAVVLIMRLVHDIDLYIWNEQTFGWDVFQNIFRAIGQLPYYPGESIEARRVHPLEKEYRVGTYVNFPESMVRTIEIKKTS